MRCPYCNEEMICGAVQSQREIFFTTRADRTWLISALAKKDEIVLSSHNWSKPTCIAYHCPVCRKVIIDYSVKSE